MLNQCEWRYKQLSMGTSASSTFTQRNFNDVTEGIADLMTKMLHSLNHDEIQVYIYQTAMLLDLKIPSACLPDVVENFERTIEIAQWVLEFELPDALETAMTFES